MYLYGYDKMGKSTPMAILSRVILSFPLCAGEAAQKSSRDLYIGKKKKKQPTSLPYLARSVF